MTGVGPSVSFRRTAEFAPVAGTGFLPALSTIPDANLASNVFRLAFPRKLGSLSPARSTTVLSRKMRLGGSVDMAIIPIVQVASIAPDLQEYGWFVWRQVSQKSLY
jgi:hypothetical protein